MARIPYVDLATASPRIRAALAGKRQLNVFRMLGNSENSGPETLALGHTLSRGSSLPPEHREVVILRVAHVSACEFMWQEHRAVAERVGFSTAKIDAIAHFGDGPDSELLDDTDLMLLHFTDSVIFTTTADDELFDTVGARYDDSKLVELVLLIGFYMMIARVMNTFQLEIHDGPVDSFPPA